MSTVKSKSCFVECPLFYLWSFKMFFFFLSNFKIKGLFLRRNWAFKDPILIKDWVCRGFFNRLLRAVSACSVLFEKWNSLFPTTNSKNTYRSRGCSVINALNLEKWEVKIHNSALLQDFLVLFWLYRTHALIF